MSDLACPSGSGSHPSGEAASASSSHGDFDPSREFREVFAEAYDWQVDENGCLWGLVRGDMGYDKTDANLIDLLREAVSYEWTSFRHDGANEWRVTTAFNALVKAIYDSGTASEGDAP